MKINKKRVVIICSLDKYANAIRPRAMKKYLEENGHHVLLLDTINLHRLKVMNNKLVANDKPLVSLNHLLLHLSIRIGFLIDTLPKFIYKQVFFTKFLLQAKIRARLLRKLVDQLEIDLLIIKNAEDSLVSLKSSSYKVLYDSPTPFSDEIYYGNNISKYFYNRLFNLEKSIYEKVDFLSFHHEAYYEYVKKHIYNGSNLINIRGGCELKKSKVSFSFPLKIVYIGGLGGYWINLPLLSKLSTLYEIDVYGDPAPAKELGLNYKGYAPVDVLRDYQLGLITISRDRLRSEGFSAKHMEYLSWGLPVLVPEWRTSAHKLKGTILYNEKNFLSVIKKISIEQKWKELSKEALDEAKTHEWTLVLQPLNRILNSI